MITINLIFYVYKSLWSTSNSFKFSVYYDDMIIIDIFSLILNIRENHSHYRCQILVEITILNLPYISPEEGEVDNDNFTGIWHLVTGENSRNLIKLFIVITPMCLY